MTDNRIDHQPWPIRAAILFVVGIAVALLFDALLPEGAGWETEPFRFAAATAVTVGGLAFAYTFERLRWWWSVLFGLGCGLVAGGIVYWNGGSEEGWRIAALLLAIAIAAPLFQVMRDEGRWSLKTRPIHAYVWTNLVVWVVSWMFVLITWLLANLMAELFGLTGLTFLKDLLRHEWFNWSIVGGALGLAIGVLRDRDSLLGVIQRIATIVLSMLTPVIAVGLGFFLLSLLFTGLGPLWETNQTTPILLACALVAFFFANGTMGIASEEEPRNPILRYGAAVLAAVIAPLAAIALVSIGLRIGQHGFTPDRLWAATCVFAAVIYGLCYWAALALGRVAWAERVRGFNTWLGVGLCVFGMLLATPLISFGAISTRDQLARLNAGTVKPEAFDWRALAFDFGPSGRKALEGLKRTGRTADIRREAGEALASKSRWDVPDPAERTRRHAAMAKARVLPRAIPLPNELATAIGSDFACSDVQSCTILYEEGADVAIMVAQPACVMDASGTTAQTCSARVRPFYRKDSHWNAVPGYFDSGASVEGPAAGHIREGWKQGRIEVRPVTRRQVFVGGEPVGQPFD